MSKFKEGDKVVISAECKDAEYRGIAGTVLEIRPYSDGLINRVCLDKSVNCACIFWFSDQDMHAQQPSEGNVLTWPKLTI